jgi:hypothetical protein
VWRQLPAIFTGPLEIEGVSMRVRDYFHSESGVYRHLSPEKRNLRATELKVSVGCVLFSTAAVLLAFLVRAIYDHKYWFAALLD